MPRPKIHDAELRARLLHRAAELISAGGVSALSLRTLAADAGTSTSAIYTLFGGKSGLLDALFVEAFTRFGASQRAVPVTADPLADLTALGIAYRVHALADPQLYGVMFGGALASFEPDVAAQQLASTTFEPVLDAASRAVRAGLLRTDDARLVATALWATLHGLVSLELMGLLCAPGAKPDVIFAQAGQANLQGWLRTSATEAVSTPASIQRGPN